MRVLGSVALALAAAARQREQVRADVTAARQTLHDLTGERELAEATVDAAQALIDTADQQLKLATAQRLAVLSEVERALREGIETRKALEAEVAELNQRRRDLAKAEVAERAQRRDDLAYAVSVDAAASEPIVSIATQLEEVPARTDLLRPTAPRKDAFTTDAPRQSVPAHSRPMRRPPTLLGLIRVASTRSPHLETGQVVLGLLIAISFAAALLLTPMSQLFGGLQLLAVTSGSMAPSIPVGGVVAIRPVPPSDLKIGDAITYADLNHPDVLITHRIVNLEQANGQTMLTTKGDANNAADSLPVPATRTVGRVDLALPVLGYVMLWLGSPVPKLVVLTLAAGALALTLARRPSRPPSPLRAPTSARWHVHF